MKKHTIRLIIGFACFSLVGLIATQLNWAKNSFKIAEEQFDSRVTIALQGALDQYMQLKDSSVCNRDAGCLAAGTNSDSLFINLVPEEMDSLLKVNFEYHGLDTIFNFAVVKCLTGEVLYEKKVFTGKTDKISTHRISLACLNHQESHHLEIGFHAKQKLILKDIFLWLLASILFLLILIFVFSYTVIGIIRQKKISEIRNDFINNMTHEFKTPIANISLASEVIKREESLSQPDKIKKYANIIFDENQRMRSQVERVLHMAVRDREDHTLHLQTSDIHQLIREAVEHMCFPECAPGAVINLELNAENPVLDVDPMHFGNIINNLLDNAKKYSRNSPNIRIKTQIIKDQFIIEISDKGIGISSESQKHIFDKFYRVPTGNLHDVKGFGLGLNYVRKMVLQHGGSISLKSELGKGSTFKLKFPIKN